MDSFLLISDYNQFIESKKTTEQLFPKRDFKLSICRRSFENALGALDLEKLETRNGELVVKVSPFLRRYFEAYNSVADQKRSHISRLRELSWDLTTALSTIERTFTEMGKVCSKLHQSSSEFNQANRNSEDAAFENTFFALQNNFICLAEVYKRESKAFKDHFHGLFADWDRELGALGEVVKTRNWLQEEYSSFKDDLRERKSKLLTTAPSKDKLEFDQISLKYACIGKDSDDFQRHKRKFMMPEVPSTQARPRGQPAEWPTVSVSSTTGPTARFSGSARAETPRPTAP